LRRVLPILGWLPHYDRRWLAADAVAGLSVWALLVPQSLAYATIAGVPVQYGLYSAFAALVLYALFGTSRQLAQGPSAAVCAVSAAVVAPLATSPEEAIGYTAALALAAAAVYLALGILKMGWVSTFLSRAVMSGFVLGFAIGIVIDQAQKLLGVTVTSDSYAEELLRTVEAIPDAQLETVAVGFGSLALLLLMRRFTPRWPRMLIVVVLAIAASSAFDFAGHGVAVTGDVPTGLFSVGLPGVGWSETGALLIGALSVVFVGFSESLAAARAMARRHHYEIDADQELIAQGMACAGGGLVGGFATDGSLSKTTVADAAGQRTQVASLVNAALVLLTMLLLASLFEQLPGATLGAVVVDAMIGLITFREFVRYRQVNRADWVFFMAAGLGILFFGITQGILIGVVLSLLLLVWRSSRTSIRELWLDPSAGVFHDASRHSGLTQVPGVLIARIDGPLFFADADRFRARMLELRAEHGSLRGVVIDADAVHLSDTDGADILTEVVDELRAGGTVVMLCGIHPPVLALWQRAGVLDEVGDDAIRETVADAVEAIDARAAAPA
jgi:SulP family sulfate permease